MTFGNILNWLDHKKIYKTLNLYTMCLSERNTSQETERQKLKSIPISNIPMDQVNITIRTKTISARKYPIALLEKFRV